MIKASASIILIAACIMLCISGCMAAAQTGNFDAQALGDAVQVPGKAAETISITTPTPAASAPADPQAAETAAPFTAAVSLPNDTPQISVEPMSTAQQTSVPSAEPSATPSPMPSAEPVSTPRPTKTPEYEVKNVDKEQAYLNAGSANFRKGPGLDYKIIEELKENAVFTVVGISGDWLKIKYDGTYGFVKAEFVEYGSPPTPTPKPTKSPEPTKTPEQTKAPENSHSNAQTASGSSSNVSNSYFSPGGGFSADELLLIAQVVQEEAKGKDVEARAAVANVIYNRLISSKYPNSVENVIFQKNQFSVADDENELRSVVPIDKTIQAVKQIFVEGNRFLPEDVLYFRKSTKGTNWSKHTYYATFGGNSFFY